MDYTGLLVKLRDLPKDKQETVYDFVEFLAARYGHCSNGWSDGACSGTRIGDAAPNTDDDPVAYSLQDLKERWR
ncbi:MULTISPECIES: DUF2281 domain-containing protein [unclassified Azospirillum]|uniref:DUF2281 domain-containing protein n=1 Tax=unclassified Azospirillum TaxID=2630922 RepID=UPI0011B23DAA|nr:MULTISPECIES: DUF2281 domain-containing protein [unclassified Azospirillum]